MYFHIQKICPHSTQSITKAAESCYAAEAAGVKSQQILVVF